MWICIEDIEWLVRWLSDELRSGGVCLPNNDPLDALTGNCEAENFHICWDFGGAWEATILQCDKEGKKYKSKLGEFNEEKWLAVEVID